MCLFSCRGRGTVIGILKIGHKKLFVYTNHGNVHEMEPLCVLDFYVHESRQRMGCGRKLFDYMLTVCSCFMYVQVMYKFICLLLCLFLFWLI